MSVSLVVHSGCFSRSCSIDQEMDGTAIMQAFAACPVPDCLREVINKHFGTRVKLYSAIKSFLEDHQSKVCFWST